MKILREIKRCTEEVLYSIIHSEDFFVIAFLLMMMMIEGERHNNNIYDFCDRLLYLSICSLFCTVVTEKLNSGQRQQRLKKANIIYKQANKKTDRQTNKQTNKVSH